MIPMVNSAARLGTWSLKIRSFILATNAQVTDASTIHVENAFVLGESSDVFPATVQLCGIVGIALEVGETTSIALDLVSDINEAVLVETSQTETVTAGPSRSAQLALPIQFFAPTPATYWVRLLLDGLPSAELPYVVASRPASIPNDLSSLATEGEQQDG